MTTSVEPVQKPEVFVRKSSGLVRTAGTWDILAYNINFTSIGLLLAFLIMLGPAFYPGINMGLSVIICVLLIIPLALVFGYLSSTMPRSGGDYVYVSRVLGPALGMMSNFNMTMWWFFYGGVPSAFLAIYGLAPFFRTMGIFTSNPQLTEVGNWFASPTGMFIFGVLLISGLIFVFARGMRSFFRIQNTLIVFAVVSTVLSAVVFIGKSQTEVLGAFNQFIGPLSGKADVASYVVSAASEGGFTLENFSLRSTLLAMTWIYLNLSFMSSSAYIGSEVKDARRLQLWSMPATVLLVGVGVLVTVLLIGNAAGYEFLGSLAWVDPAELGISSTPLYTELAAYVSGNVVIAFLITFGFIFWSYAWLPGQILNGSRNILAYAIDGLIPAWFRQVHPKLHTPVPALATMGIMSIIALAVYVFTPYFATLVGIFGFILSFSMVSISAILLPYRLPDVFETSAVNQRVGGIPVISIIGTLSLISCIIMAWAFISDPLAGLTPSMILFNIGVFLSGLVVYYVAKWVRSRRGVDVSLSYKELPSE
jgi:basic amino acid/polyamine antiporter, APA family